MTAKKDSDTALTNDNGTPAEQKAADEAQPTLFSSVVSDGPAADHNPDTLGVAPEGDEAVPYFPEPWVNGQYEGGTFSVKDAPSDPSK